MSNEDLKHLITNKQIPIPRKRNIVNGNVNEESVKIKVPLPELDFNDPDFLKLLKEYEDDSDSSNERKQFEAQRGIKKASNNALNNGVGYTILAVVVLIFIIVINWFNSKELERLKEEFGFEDRKLYTEQWWKRGFFYALHVPTFADSNNDQIGDINGIRKHINDLEYLGIDAVILTCITGSNIFNDHYLNCGATINFMDINSIYGNMDDLRRLIHELNEKKIKVIIQIDPNHTHEKHEWFIKSKTIAEKNSFDEYYVWSRGKTLSNDTIIPPNNWLSIDGTSAWSNDPIKKNFYYHAYQRSLPDLNHRNPDVRNEFLKIFEFWLDKGADGILLTSVNKLLEVDDKFLDEPVNEFSHNLTGYDALQHVYTLDQPDIHDYISSWRQFFEEYFISRQKHFCLLLDVGTNPLIDMVRYHHTGADLALANSFPNLPEICGGECIHEILEGWMSRIGDEAIWMRYELVNNGLVKMNNKDAFNILLLMLPGAALLHQQDLLYSYQNDQSMKLIELIHRLSRLRRDRSFLIGQLKFIHIDKSILAFVRFANSEKRSSKPLISSLKFATNNLGSKKNLNVADIPLKLTDADMDKVKKLDLSQTDPDIFTEYIKNKDPSLNQNIEKERFDPNEALFSSSAPYVVALNFGQHRSTVDLATTLGSTKGRAILTFLNSVNEERVVEGGIVDLVNFTLYPSEGIILIPLLEEEN